MSLDILKRAEAGAPLTIAQHDANMTAIEAAVNANEAAIASKETSGAAASAVAAHVAAADPHPGYALESSLSSVATSGAYADLSGAPTLGTAAATDATAYATAAQGTDAREWTAVTVDQAEAEAGTATTRRAWTSQRVGQAIASQVAAWWAALTVAPSKVTMAASGKLLGRSTSGGGSTEEIAIGAGLTLDAGTLSASGGGGGGGAATNLAYVASPTDGTVTSDSGTDATLTLADGTNAGLMAPSQVSKLSGIASGATANASDAQLRDRATHTGTQAASSISDFDTAADARIAAASVSDLADVAVTSPSTGQVLKWSGSAWVNDTDSTAGGAGATNLSYTASPTNGVVVSDTGTDAAMPLADATNAGLMAPAQVTKLLGIATGATANSSDATLLARANHTGTQSAATITGLATVATTGDYADLTGKPTLGTAAATAATDYATAAQGAKADAAAVAGAIGSSNLTMSTARLLGRSTAGTGAPEEITLGTNLSFTGTTLNAAGGGGSPGGSSGELQTNDGAGGFAAVSGVTSPGAGSLDFATGTLTASRPSLNVTTTWNNASISFDADLVNVTNTASAAASSVIHRKVGGATVFRVQRDGAIYSGANLSIRPISGGYSFVDPFANFMGSFTTYELAVPYAIKLGTAYGTTYLSGALGSNSIVQENGSNTQSYYLVHAGGANYERLALRSVTGASAQIATQAGGTGTRRNIQLSAPQVSVDGLFIPNQYTTATRPAWANGAVIFDTDLGKMVIGGASAWEVVTSA